ncbi:MULTISPECIES: Holliday junction resolvase RuvX [unclassified Desulfurobacterium]|uniref:Holliday junction resolvase RuvX n=1 Tax=unclassified Desulfurobacterium TaxID=2639089 RepID=UPI0003B6E10C|nr:MULTISPECIES: Holliday junction resolvase RuvX [unclassified Desulfurobacterium]
MGQRKKEKQGTRRYLALDVGFKKIGVAVSLSGVIAKPEKIIFRKTNLETFKEIEELIRKLGISTIVVGLPLSATGEKTKIAEKIEKFTEKLSSYLKKTDIDVEIVFHDESLSTVTAENIETLKNRKEKDDVAAAVILQEYLDTAKD